MSGKEAVDHTTDDNPGPGPRRPGRQLELETIILTY